MSDHRARYKNTGLDAKELRRRREEDSVQLRKQKRDDVLSKRRTLAPTNDKDEMLDDDELGTNCSDLSDYNQQYTFTKEMVEILMHGTDLSLLIDNAQRVRKILSKEPQPPIDEVIESGLVPRFIQLLDRSDCTILQFEVAWILTNICSGTSEQTKKVVDNGVIPKLITLMASQDIRVCEQAVWALGNIIGDCAKFRDIVIGYQFVPALLNLIRPDVDLNFLRNETWVLVNLCRNKDPPPHVDVIKQIIPALQYLITCSDLAVLIDTTWAVSYITELGPEYCQLVIDSGLVAQMIPLLTYDDVKIQTASIRALGSIVTGNEEQTQAVIDAGALPYLLTLLNDNKDRIVKEALWFISNITAGSTNQIQAVIDNQFVPKIKHFLDNGDFIQQKEAAWAIYNTCLSGTPKQLEFIVKENILPSLCNLLNIPDNNLVTNVLESVSCILNVCHDSEVLESIEECGGLDKIENLQSSSNTDIYNFAYGIIDQYFNDASQDNY